MRQVSSADREYDRALHLALAATPRSATRPAREVADLLAHARRTHSSLDLTFAAYLGGDLLGAAVALESPGASALVFASGDKESEAAVHGASAALDAVKNAAWQRSIHLLESLIDPEWGKRRATLELSGFRRLTRLLYLCRSGAAAVPACKAADGLTWTSYRPDRDALFRAALEATYAQSLDCPELTGVRSTAEVLAGHKACGWFDPQLWWVVTRGAAPVGVILLNRMPGRGALELAYMGVAQASRGKGVADALLRRAVSTAEALNVTVMALAVDQRNTPAMRMYEKWGFVASMAREAWIATSPRST